MEKAVCEVTALVMNATMQWGGGVKEIEEREEMKEETSLPAASSIYHWR